MWNVVILALLPALVPGPASGQTKPTLPEPKGLRLTITATTERIPLGNLRGPVELSVDALSRRIRLRPSPKDSPAALATRISKHVGMLCPNVRVANGVVELDCRSRRIESQITPEGKTSYLDINELRGLPWRGTTDAPPSYHFDPWKIGLGQSCPGKSEAAQGECRLRRGEILEAATHFRAALATTQRAMACLRLGDLALGTGDPITAAGWYRRAGSFGFFGRIADSRLCELDGKCLGSTEEVMRVFDSNGFPEPMRAESVMRAIRAEAYAGRLPSAAHMMARQVRAHGTTSLCREGNELLCRRILLEAMRAAGSALGPIAWASHRDARTPSGTTAPASRPLDKSEREYLEELIESYLAIPSWEKGPLAVEMAQAAAPLAARLGATAFGGNLLASLAPEVPDAQLSDHLLLAAETFLGGQNWARARIVTEYAQTRLPAKVFKTPRWIAVQKAMSGRAEEDEVSPAVREAIEAELLATLAELKNARSALAKAEGVLGGARDATSARAAAAKEGAAGAGTNANSKPNTAMNGNTSAATREAKR